MTLPTKFKTFQNSEGVITRLPAKFSKKVELADWALSLFEPGKVYDEKQVNETIGQYIEDFALIRRLLVDDGKLERDTYGREYRRVVAEPIS
jgi:hypothetical protein